MHLTDPESSQAVLRNALRNRNHWVLATDCPEGHVVLVTLAWLLEDAGALERAHYGTIDVVLLPAPAPVTVSVLAAHKRDLEWQDIVACARGFRRDLPEDPAGGDVILLLGEHGDPVALQAFLSAVQDGLCRPAGRHVWN